MEPMNIEFDIDYTNVLDATIAIREMTQAIEDCSEATEHLVELMSLMNELLEEE